MSTIALPKTDCPTHPETTSFSILQGDLMMMHSGEKGRMLVAGRQYAANGVVASIIAYPIPETDLKYIKTTDAYKYVFYDPSFYTDVSTKPVGFLAFGAMAFCNHSSNPNAFIRWGRFKDETTMTLLAHRDISQGEEITMRYANIDEYLNSNQWKS
ncbi:SET domain-containing protein-lysine N-methyltransferase [Palleronia caenipelagi]|uniref:SET domain-containing protein n=1 Tax=Palleronia caenipelagi TaxID=2489174 RepID=A0A547PJH2_9RHOB|nr:SET domain-containing protein-lysine N-methyltransferase [Palleronia caenipelagi]TRD14164.1 SET domain-containing protein [Palleronia caenipelagi]